MNWTTDGRHHSAEWPGGVLQVSHESGAAQPWKWATLEHGAIIGQGREDTIEAAKAAAEGAIPR